MDTQMAIICVDTREVTADDTNITLISSIQDKGFSVLVSFKQGKAYLVNTKTTQMVTDQSFSSVNIENGWSFDYTKVKYESKTLTIDLRSRNAYDDTGFKKRDNTTLQCYLSDLQPSFEI